MSKNEFDELLLKKFREAELEYNPASWDKLSQLLSSSPAAGDSSFDELLRNKLQDDELEYKAEHWEQLALLLPPTLVPVSDRTTFTTGNKNKRWGLAAGIAAAIVLMVGTVFFFRQINNGPDKSIQPSLVKKDPKSNNSNTTIPQNNTNAVTNTPQNPAIAHQNNVQPQTASPVQQQAAKNNTQNNSLYNTINPTIPNIITPQQPEQIAQNNIIPSQPAIIQEKPPVEQKITTLDKENQVRENYAYNNTTYTSAFYEGNGKNNKKAKTSVALGGGVNYGNLNTGYSAGVSIRRKVAGDFFVDGTVAMMYNNNANNVAINNGPSLSDNNNTAARPAAFNETPLASPALDPIQKLYYVQFNPSIGYQIEKHVALSVGGDFQKMLNKTEEIVQPESNNSKLFPNLDVGLTAKSEFSITPNIQAGLMYREGLNNLLKNDGSKYVNRRYIQVQFKYNIPVN
ncbi:MAG: hypothetical protein WC756_15660 [Taibaiella sp.]|jgi:hypothetical protein